VRGMKGASNWRIIGLVSAVVMLLGLVAVPTSMAGPTTTRPVGDFVNAQLFTIFWTDPARDLLAVVDYAGERNNLIQSLGGASLGTSFGGQVTERPLPDGRAEVTVVLETTNAFVVARQLSTGTLYFGYAIPQVVGGAEAALSRSTFRLVFTNTGVGDPLPDLVQLLFEPLSGQEVRSISIAAAGSGTFRAAFGVPDGTPGRVQVTQTGLFMTAFKGATADGFPAEHVLLRVVGR